jgi:hypothetical protein
VYAIILICMIGAQCPEGALTTTVEYRYSSLDVCRAVAAERPKPDKAVLGCMDAEHIVRWTDRPVTGRFHL